MAYHLCMSYHNGREQGYRAGSVNWHYKNYPNGNKFIRLVLDVRNITDRE
jgi:hypothetical protein